MVGRREEPTKIKNQEKADTERNEAKWHEDHVQIVAALNSAVDEIRANRDQQATQDRKSNTLEKWG